MHTRRTSFFAGALIGAVVMALALEAGAVIAGRRAQAVKDTSTVVLENERVRVRDVTFPPGVMDTGLHTHDLPHVGVILSAGALVFTESGKTTETATFETGSVDTEVRMSHTRSRTQARHRCA